MEIQFGEKVYDNVPETYDEMSLGKFMDVMKLQNKQKDYENPTMFMVDLIAAIIGCDSDVILSLNHSDLETLTEAFTWLNKEPEKRNVEYLEIDGNIYVPKKNNQITLGEQISIETFLKKDLTNIDNYHYVMAILLRPGKKVGDEYVINPLENDIDKINKRAELFKEKLMINDIFGIISFFSTGVSGSSTKNSGAFSIRRADRRKSQNS